MSVPATDGTGHRERLRERLFADADGLMDHELIEMLLQLVIPRVDTKPVAKRLLHEFGGIGGLLTADAAQLSRVGGIGERSVAAIKVAQATAVRMLRAQVHARPVLSNWQALLDYLRADMAHHAIERVRVLHLNSKNMLIQDELMGEGTLDEAPVYVREVIRRALELGSAALILVHNHPSGDPTPSRADIDVTRAVANAGKPLNIAVHDHIIMAAGSHVSLRAQGLLSTDVPPRRRGPRVNQRCAS